jgi:cytochrome c
LGRFNIIVGFLFICALLAIAGGCSAGSTDSSPASKSAAASAASPAGPTFGSMSQLGQIVFANRCTQCHGASGQGVTAPAIIGANASLGKYNTAKGLFDFISTAMPFNAPGSLSHQDYLNVLCFLLVENNYASPNSTFNENALAGVKLK